MSFGVLGSAVKVTGRRAYNAGAVVTLVIFMTILTLMLQTGDQQSTQTVSVRTISIVADFQYIGCHLCADLLVDIHDAKLYICVKIMRKIRHECTCSVVRTI